RTTGASLYIQITIGVIVWSRRSEEHTSELQSREKLVCRLLPEKKKRRPRPPAQVERAADALPGARRVPGWRPCFRHRARHRPTSARPGVQAPARGFCTKLPPPRRAALFPYTTLFRSSVPPEPACISR